MADTLDPHEPAAAAGTAGSRSCRIRSRLVEEPFVAMVDLRVDPSGPGAAAAADVLGVDAADHTVHLRQKR